jgi:hypothetical protein
MVLCVYFCSLLNPMKRKIRANPPNQYDGKLDIPLVEDTFVLLFFSCCFFCFESDEEKNQSQSSESI